MTEQAMTMAECRICKAKAEQEEPVQLVCLPRVITAHSVFNHKSAPIYVCPECDGGVVKAAYGLHGTNRTG